MAKKKKLSPKDQQISFSLNEKQAALATAFLTLIYFGFSFVSDGFYQHDEVAHFINMRDFWKDPSVILGNWAKPGYKLIFALPSLGGPLFLAFFNAAVAAGSIYVAWKIARHLKVNYAWLVFFIAGLNPMWIELAYRNYSEFISALLLLLGVYLSLKRSFVGAALILSYLTLIRQEAYIWMVPFGIWMLTQKQWKAILALAVFPLAINFWGGYLKGDAFYLINSTLNTADSYKDAYVRQGFDHYFLMAAVMWGSVMVILLWGSIVGMIKKWVTPSWILILPVLIYFGVHLLFNIQTFAIGPSTGGNLRYMMVIAPILAIISIQGLGAMERAKKDNKTLLFIVLGGLVILYFTGFNDNRVNLTEARNGVLILTGIFTLGIMFFVTSFRWASLGIGVLSLWLAIGTIEKYELTTEDKTVQRAATWVLSQNLTERPMFIIHTVMHFYLNKTRKELPEGSGGMYMEQVQSAPKGSIAVWDSHYSYRPKLRSNSVPYSFFTENSEDWALRQQFVSPDERFGMLIFEKIR